MAVKHLHPQGDVPAPGIFRRVASALYDMMLCLAMLMVLTLVYQQVVLRMIYGAETLEAMSNAGQLDRDPLLTVLMILAIYGFFILFWTLRGQTLGLQAWRLRVRQPDATSITRRQALHRRSASPASCLCGRPGAWWAPWARHSRPWPAIAPGTRTAVLPTPLAC